MKYNGDYQIGLSFEQYKGGYIIREHSLGGKEPIIFESFEKAYERMAGGFWQENSIL